MMNKVLFYFSLFLIFIKLCVFGKGLKNHRTLTIQIMLFIRVAGLFLEHGVKRFLSAISSLFYCKNFNIHVFIFSVCKEAGHNTMKTIYIPLSKIDEKIKFQKI